jgi:hypothetical protein
MVMMVIKKRTNLPAKKSQKKAKEPRLSEPLKETTTTLKQSQWKFMRQ